MFKFRKKIINKPISTAERIDIHKYESRIIKPIFIIGCGRSGTTLLFDLLKTHSELAATTGYPDGEDHEGWIEHGNCIISGLGSQANINGGHTGYHYCLYMDENNVTQDIVTNMTVYYNRNVLKLDKSKRVVNKCPHLSNKLRYVNAIFPDAKFIHIIRDCLPVVSSWMKIMENQPNQVLYWPETNFPCFWVFPAPIDGNRKNIFKNESRIFPGQGTAKLVDYWSEVNRNIPLQLSSVSDQLLTVKYEELCEEPLKILHQISDFCEIEHFDDIPIDIHRNLNDKFKSLLTDAQIDEFLNQSTETRSFFGYG